MPVKIKHPVPSDIDIAQAAKLRPILDIAEEIGLREKELELFGRYKAKVHLEVRDRLTRRKNGKYIDVTAITPTPLGEGKTTTSVGLTQALGAHLGKRTIACIRQPSMGPTFGIKGGAAGGGYSQIVPMEDFNLHLTGDIHAVTRGEQPARRGHRRAHPPRARHAATTRSSGRALCPDGTFARRDPQARPAARHQGARRSSDLTPEDKRRLFRLDIDPASITWQRVVDVNDRHLRRVQIGLGDEEKGNERLTGFDISVGERGDGDPRPDHGPRGHARAPGPHRDRHEHRRASR